MELLKEICRRWNLGEPVSAPSPLTGGLMHKMYGVTTDKGKYAVKLLNPYIMRRETAKSNFETAERLERILEGKDVPILPARTLGGRKMQELDGQFFYLFDWYEGRALYKEEISSEHCRKMGEALARIHRIVKKNSGGKITPVHIDWMFYDNAVRKTDEEIFRLLDCYVPSLVAIQERGNRACGRVPAISAICHNDMDSKNVLWKGEEYRIIDLECLAYSNPLAELLETALSWSGFEEGCFDPVRFHIFIEAYREESGEPIGKIDWESLYDSRSGPLFWLEYNLKRVLGIECESSEKEIGRAQTIKTLEQIVYSQKMRKTVLDLIG